MPGKQHRGAAGAPWGAVGEEVRLRMLRRGILVRQDIVRHCPKARCLGRGDRVAVSRSSC